MDNVIPFPRKHDSFEQLADWIASVCRRGGLTEPMIENVIERYREIHPKIFDTYRAELTLQGLGLNQEQADAIAETHTDVVEKIFDHFRDQKVYAAQTIIGLLANDELNNS